MSSFGKTINLYLMDGSASGRWQVSLSNWNGRAYKIPHGDLKSSSNLEYINTPGVYFLFGKDDATDKQFIYIGEADETLKRLLQPHTFEKDGTYWTEAVVFITPDGTLEKGRVKYLENRFYTLATEAKRYIVKNGNTPKQSPMPPQIQDMLEEFIANVELVLPAMGHKAFEPLPSSDEGKTNDDGLLYFFFINGAGGKATGKVSSDGFWVLKGSYINPELASYSTSGIRKAREKYAKIINKKGILQEDICFGSPSFASTFVCGNSSNGLLEWKNSNGVSLKDLDTDENSEPDNPPIQPYVPPDDQEILHIAGKKIAATGKITENGFLVFKESEFSQTETNSCPSGIRKLRKKLVDEGKVQNGVFQEDVLFTSPSTAAACVMGASENGKKVWLYPDNQSIRDKE